MLGAEEHALLRLAAVMMYCSKWFTFKIPDVWWDAAGMRDFKTENKLYRLSLQSRADADATVIMLIDNIGPGPRSPAMPRFDRNRIISELRAIRLGYAMSPIEVTKATDQDYTHILYHGRHRLAASIAVGYPLVPTVIRGQQDQGSRGRGLGIDARRDTA